MKTLKSFVRHAIIVVASFFALAGVAHAQFLIGSLNFTLNSSPGGPFGPNSFTVNNPNAIVSSSGVTPNGAFASLGGTTLTFVPPLSYSNLSTDPNSPTAESAVPFLEFGPGNIFVFNLSSLYMTTLGAGTEAVVGAGTLVDTDPSSTYQPTPASFTLTAISNGFYLGSFASAPEPSCSWLGLCAIVALGCFQLRRLRAK